RRPLHQYRRGGVSHGESRPSGQQPSQGRHHQRNQRPLRDTRMSKPTVLVAEDEGALVTLLRYNLEREGYRVLEARDGEEALLVAAEEQPDLVVLDWMLPQLSGIEVCRRLRGRQETRNVPIVMLTA